MEPKENRTEKYNACLSRVGKTLADCRVIGYQFPDEQRMHFFHFSMMQAKVFYFMFDGFENKAVILMKKSCSEKEVQIVDRTAKEFFGEEYKPKMI